MDNTHRVKLQELSQWLRFAMDVPEPLREALEKAAMEATVKVTPQDVHIRVVL